MKTKDLHAMSLSDLEKHLKSSRQELFNLRFQMATGQLENHRQIRHVRRDLAQILTEIHQKRLAAEASPPQSTPSTEDPHGSRRRKPRAEARS